MLRKGSVAEPFSEDPTSGPLQILPAYLVGALHNVSIFHNTGGNQCFVVHQLRYTNHVNADTTTMPQQWKKEENKRLRREREMRSSLLALNLK